MKKIQKYFFQKIANVLYSACNTAVIDKNFYPIYGLAIHLNDYAVSKDIYLD